MPEFDILKIHKPSSSFRVLSVAGTYDLQTTSIEERFVGKIDLPDEWNIGLIVGKSGSGKTTIARQLFNEIIIENFEYKCDSVLDDMPKQCTVKQICKAFNSVGFSTPPSWLKPYSVLSNGEKMRCDLARAILEDKEMFCFDEYTSVVDRNVAKIGSLAMQKAIRKANKKFIAVTCHYDVEEWLMPDWIFNADTMTFHLNEELKKNKPVIKLDVYETREKQKFWDMFKKYHYLSHSFNKSARVFLCLCNGHLCGMCAVLSFPHPKRKNTWKEHRTVIFPDYQGIGIGSRFTNEIAELFKQENKSFISTSSNPAFIHSRKNDSKWIVTKIGRQNTGSNSGKIHKKGSTSSKRITASFEYIGHEQISE